MDNPSSHPRYAGYSLLELCTVIFILGMGMGVALSTYHRFLMRLEREAVFDRLKTAIAFARQEALIGRKTITLCASQNHQTCTENDWSHGFMVFETFHSGSATVLHPLLSFPRLQHGKLYFEQFGKHLTINANGRTINAGIFIYCPYNQDRREADALVINLLARTYRPTHRNSQGILLKNSGAPTEIPLTCR